MNVAICDDEKIFRTYLRELLVKDRKHSCRNAGFCAATEVIWYRSGMSGVGRGIACGWRMARKYPLAAVVKKR